MRIEAKSPKLGKRVEFNLDVPDSLDGMIEAYGEYLVYQLAYRQIRNSVSVTARNMLLRGVPEAEIEEKVPQTWSPRYSQKSGGLLSSDDFESELERTLNLESNSSQEKEEEKKDEPPKYKF